jgi:hypothetical protein
MSCPHGELVAVRRLTVRPLLDKLKPESAPGGTRRSG